MRKVLVLILALVMLLGLLPAGFASAENEAERALLSDHLDYLFRTEQNSEAMLWALRYAEAALDENEWDSILKAKLAVSTAVLYVSATELYEDQTSDEMYAAFDRNNQDVLMVNAERWSYALEKKTLLDALNFLTYNLETGVFSKASVNTMKTYIRQQKESCEIELEYLSATSYYLIDELGSSGATEKFLKTAKEACPLIFGYGAAEKMTQNERETYVTELLDKIEALSYEMERLTTRMQLDLNDLMTVYETGNYAELEADRNAPGGIPYSLPFPIWEEKTISAVYYLKDGDGNVSVPKPGDTIEAIPNVCVLTFTGVEEEAVYAYMLLLMDSGIAVVEDDVKEDSFEALCSYESTSFLVSWEDGNAVLIMPDGIVCLTLS